MNSFKKKT